MDSIPVNGKRAGAQTIQPASVAVDSTSDSTDFLAGGGEMGALMRKADWSKTTLGPPESWQRSLKTVVHIILTSRYPMFIWWGSKLTNLYNDAYAPMCGKRHPRALGESARKTWTEIWDTVGPQTKLVMKDGQATWNDELLLVMERNGFPEEAYFTFSYSPIMDDAGHIGGLLGVVTEDTAKVLSRRRLKTLRDIGEWTLSETKSAEEAVRAAAVALTDNPNDIPFALVYLLGDDARTARLVDAIRLDKGVSAAPIEIEIGNAGDVWQFGQVLESGNSHVVDKLTKRFGRLPAGAWATDKSERAVVLPLSKAGIQESPTGFLITGISPRLQFDDEYRGFFDLVASHIATAVANARVYEQERQRAEALAEIDRAKTLFFSNVSHEFRTPLTLMLGPLEDALADPDLPAAERERLDVAHRNSLRLLKLVNSLLDFSRIEAGRAQATYEPVDLATVTADLASSFRSACDRAGLELLVDCRPLPERVYVDRDMWEKIVLNLLSNAFKFTLEGKISIGLRIVDGEAQLSVSDTGVGIPEHELPRLFERFHRIEGQKSRTYEGSGIGLALVQELVKLHGGTVKAERGLDCGTTFIVGIPLGTLHLPQDRIGAERRLASTAVHAEAYTQEALRWLRDGTGSETRGAIEEPANISRPLMGARILVADDNADMRAYVRRLLGPTCEVETVADGQAALDAAKARRPDLILADIMMPRLDGFALLKAVRSDPELREIPLMLLSARAGEEAKVEGLQAGADDYLIKPFSARELLARVDATLAMARVRREGTEALRKNEARQAYLVKLGDALRPLGDPIAIQEVAAQLLGCQLAANRAMYFEFRVEDGREYVVVDRDYHDADTASAVGRVAAARLGSDARDIRAGRIVAVSDKETELPTDEERAVWRALGVRAYIAVPLVKDGRLLAGFGVHQSAPRVWTAEEIALVQETAERTWAAVERARAEERLRRSEADLRARNDELARFNRAAVGREMRMIELKKEINALCVGLGEPVRYPLEFERNGRNTHG